VAAPALCMHVLWGHGCAGSPIDTWGAEVNLVAVQADTALMLACSQWSQAGPGPCGWGADVSSQVSMSARSLGPPSSKYF
jgi:hypothetical protein